MEFPSEEMQRFLYLLFLRGSANFYEQNIYKNMASFNAAMINLEKVEWIKKINGIASDMRQNIPSYEITMTGRLAVKLWIVNYNDFKNR